MGRLEEPTALRNAELMYHAMPAWLHLLEKVLQLLHDATLRLHLCLQILPPAPASQSEV
jgi:hypothetical protein